MPGTILVVGEVVDGKLTKLATEVATLARRLAEAGGLEVVGSLAPGVDEAATELARFTGGRVVACAVDDSDDRTPVATTMAEDALELARAADWILLGASPNGKDAAGILAARLGRGVLANATGVAWQDGGPVVEMSVFGGKLVTRSAFTTPNGIVTIRPNAVAAEPAAQPGTVERTTTEAETLPYVTVVERVEESGAEVSLEDARIVVAGGRGVGGPDGLRIAEDLAQELGGVVGATRAAVDSGWIPYARQIGQTGKTVKPALYLALGVSGAIQHRVGMQGAETIVAVNRDADAPIAEFADLLVVGDLFEVGPAILAELRARRGG